MKDKRAVILSSLQVASENKIDSENKNLDWYLIVPTGYFPNHPSGSFTIKENTLDSILWDFNSRNIDIVVDFHHQSVKAQETGIKAEAAGWVKELKKVFIDEEFFIAAGIEWVVATKKAIEEKKYKYLSPVLVFEGTEGDAWLHSVALVNDPFFSQGELTEAKLNSLIGNVSNNQPKEEEKNMPFTEEQKKEVQGIVKEAVADAVKTAIGDAKNEITREVTTTMENSRKQNQDIEKEVNSLIEEGKVAPYQKETIVAACSSNPDLLTEIKEKWEVSPQFKRIMENHNLRGKGDFKQFSREDLLKLDTQEKINLVTQNPELLSE